MITETIYQARYPIARSYRAYVIIETMYQARYRIARQYRAH